MTVIGDSFYLYGPSLRATFIGSINGSVEKYQNIKYGQFDCRFSLPRKFTYPKGSTVDCTRQGPICPQDTPYRDSLIGVPEDLVEQFKLNYNEFECLNLMVTRPTCRASNENEQIHQMSLPVMVWIHGGGNIAGTPYRHICDPLNLVQRSVEIGKPVIIVSVQYRVHLFGWLPFNGIGNFGLHDQKLALQWVHDHISDFGGDPSKVTLVGQSAGSCCAIRHVQNSTESGKLFQQAAFLSGSMSSMTPVSLHQYHQLATCVAQKCKVDVNSLVSIPWESLVSAIKELGIQILYPVDDGIFLPKGGYSNYDLIRSNSLNAILISDSKEDGYFFLEGLSSFSEQQLQQLIVNAGGSACLDRYQGIHHLNDLMTDLCFCKGNEDLDCNLRSRKKSTSLKVFRQFFDAMNPLSPHFGSNHMVEVLYYFGAYLNQQTVDNNIMNLCHQCQDTLLSFFHGNDPWPEEQIMLVTDRLQKVDYDRRSWFRRLDNFPSLEFGQTGDINYRKAIHVLLSDGWINIDVETCADK